jgi:hypothetical protein
VVVTFNESLIVMRLLAAKVWPGPVVINVAVGGKFLPLRCPCHPLTVKVCQEFHQQDKKLIASPSTAQNQFPGTPNCNEQEGCSSASKILVGWPLRMSSSDARKQEGCHEDTFVVTAKQAVTSQHKDVTAVLNGEERREMFAVPTCEHARPFPLQLQIDAAQRTVTLLRSSSQSNEILLDEPRLSPNSVTGNNKLVSWGTGRSSLTVYDLLQALRSFHPKDRRERVAQAVLLKWKVVERKE